MPWPSEVPHEGAPARHPLVRASSCPASRARATLVSRAASSTSRRRASEEFRAPARHRREKGGSHRRASAHASAEARRRSDPCQRHRSQDRRSPACLPHAERRDHLGRSSVARWEEHEVKSSSGPTGVEGRSGLSLGLNSARACFLADELGGVVGSGRVGTVDYEVVRVVRQRGEVEPRRPWFPTS